MSLKRYIDALINDRIARIFRGRRHVDEYTYDDVKKDVLTAQQVISAVIHRPKFATYQRETKRTFGRLMKLCVEMTNILMGLIRDPVYYNTREQQFKARWKNSFRFRERVLNGDEIVNYCEKAITIIKINEPILAQDEIDDIGRLVAGLFKKVIRGIESNGRG